MERNRGTFRRPPGPDRDAEFRIRLRGLAEERRCFGSPWLQILLRREGIIVNHKRVERVYREEGLSLWLKNRRKRVSSLWVVHGAESALGHGLRERLPDNWPQASHADRGGPL